MHRTDMSMIGYKAQAPKKSKYININQDFYQLVNCISWNCNLISLLIDWLYSPIVRMDEMDDAQL